MNKNIRMTNKKREEITGYLFILPFILGFIFLFIRPMISSIVYSISSVAVADGGLDTSFSGFSQYIRAFTIDPKVLPALVASVTNLIYEVPLIVIFSLFIALILNQKFKGRLLVRAIFFLPVIIASGIIITILKQDVVSQMFLAGSKSTTMVQITVLRDIMITAGLTNDIVSYIIGMMNNIFELSWKSGIQILLFIAGLQTIPSQLYEVAKIEGATAWESFWKVTFPLLTPIMLLNVIYSIIDSFTDPSNDIMAIILDYGQRLNFSYSAALSWIYFLVISVILFIVYRFINRKSFYMGE